MNYFNLRKYSQTLTHPKNDCKTIVAMPMVTDNIRFHVTKLDYNKIDIKMYHEYPMDAEFPPKPSIFDRVWLFNESTYKVGWARLSPAELSLSKSVHLSHEQASQYYVVDHMLIYPSAMQKQDKSGQPLGFGPALYDKCIEIATNEGRKLINSQNYSALKKGLSYNDSDVYGTSDAAQKVWKRYQTRDDVTKHPLPTGGDGGFALSKPGKFFYEK